MTARAVPPNYRGYPRIRVARKSWGEGTVHFCRVPCEDCSKELERSTSNICQNERSGASFLCPQCSQKRMVAKRMKKFHEQRAG